MSSPRMLYCKSCNSVYSTVKIPADPCPTCNCQLFETKMSKQDWDTKTKEEKKSLKLQWLEDVKNQQTEALNNRIQSGANTVDTYKEIAVEQLRGAGSEGYYEYTVKSIVDERGRSDTAAMINLLNEMGLAGWRLVTAHTNELGKNMLSFYGFGVNSTADETVLIFERYLKI